MNKFINAKIMPPILKVVNTKALTALKNGMIFALPFIIIGSVFLILSNIPIVSVSNWLAANGWSAFFSQAYAVSFGILSVWACVGISYCYVRDENHAELSLSAGLTALSAFFIVQSLSVSSPITAALSAGKTASGIGTLTGTQAASAFHKLPEAMQVFLNNPVTGVLNLSWLGGKGMIAAILIGIFTGWGYSKIIKAGWKITLPEQVPSNVANQFTSMIPSAIVIAAATVVYTLFQKTLNTDALSWIYTIIQAPLQHLSDSLPSVILIAFLTVFLWFFGVHGGVIIGAVSSAVLIPNTFANAQLYKAGKLTLADGAHVVTNEFFNTVGMTGAGITFGIIVFTLFFAKSEQMKSLGKIEAIPGLFNINEPFLFGLPFVLNPILALPFFATPVITAILSYFFIRSGILPPLNGVAVPWTTPPIIQGFLMGGWQWALWQAIVLAMSSIIYFPFARRYDKILLEQEQKGEVAANN